MGKVWYKSKDLERIEDVYRGTTVFVSAIDEHIETSDGVDSRNECTSGP
jgi:hypothetical protein